MAPKPAFPPLGTWPAGAKPPKPKPGQAAKAQAGTIGQ
jgi:hypothetical protein